MIRLRTQTNGSLEAVRQPGDLRGIANTSMHREQQVVCMRLEIESGYLGPTESLRRLFRSMPTPGITAKYGSSGSAVTTTSRKKI